MRPIPKIAGVPEELIVVLNDRLREIDSQRSQSSESDAALPLVGTPGRYTKVTTDAQGRVIQGGQLQTSDLPGGGYPSSVPSPSTQSVETGSRALATVYQNTTGKPKFVTVSASALDTGTPGGIQAYTDASNPPTTVVADVAESVGGAASYVVTQCLSFWVLPGNYYKVTAINSGATTPALVRWTEWY